MRTAVLHDAVCGRIDAHAGSNEQTEEPSPCLCEWCQVPQKFQNVDRPYKISFQNVDKPYKIAFQNVDLGVEWYYKNVDRRSENAKEEGYRIA